MVGHWHAICSLVRQVALAEYSRRHHPHSKGIHYQARSHPEDTMSKSVQLIKDHDVKWIDLRFTDTKGTQHHVTMPARDALDDDFLRSRQDVRRFLHRWLERHRSLRHDPDAGRQHCRSRPVHRRADPDPGLRRHRAFDHARLRPRPTCDRQACRGIPEVHRYRRHRIRRSRARILHLRLR